jgi:NAD(P)-dependent dehydrogenase (short-subunit alcohol dehydrogenase family)
VSARVVITGANRGLGLGLARAYAARGDEVWATARRPTEATELQALTREAAGRVHVHAVDVRSGDDVRSLATAVAGANVDLLINNAGIASEWSAALPTFDADEALDGFDTNALGPLRLAQAFLPNLRAARGKVVNMTSLMGSIADNGSGRAYPYRLSKAALNMATRNLAHELRPLGAIAVSLHPGWVKTEMGGAGATEEIGDAVARLVALIDRLRPEDSGKFWHAKGQELPW